MSASNGPHPASLLTIIWFHNESGSWIDQQALIGKNIFCWEALATSLPYWDSFGKKGNKFSCWYRYKYYCIFHVTYPHHILQSFTIEFLNCHYWLNSWQISLILNCVLTYMYSSFLIHNIFNYCFILNPCFWVTFVSQIALVNAKQHRIAWYLACTSSDTQIWYSCCKHWSNFTLEHISKQGIIFLVWDKNPGMGY